MSHRTNKLPARCWYSRAYSSSFWLIEFSHKLIKIRAYWYRALTRGFRWSIEVDADDTRVLYILFLVNVASRRHKEEKLLKMWAYFSKAQHYHLTGGYENAYSKLTTSPNAEGLKTNHHNISLP